MYKILLVGCGELGSRFLESIIQVNSISQIDIIEPNEKSKNIALERIHNYNSKINIYWYRNFDNKITNGDLALITTHSDIRFELFESALKLGYRKFILEKVVTQSDFLFRKMINLTTFYNANVWVNCKTRAYPIWQYIKTKIKKNEKLNYISLGGNHGLCTNGLHTIDLFVFLTESQNLNIINHNIDNKLLYTKRGKYDLSGDINLENPFNKSQLFLKYDNTNVSMPVEIVTTSDFKWIIDNSNRLAYESSIETNFKLNPIPFEGNLMVSEMTKDFVIDIFSNGSCKLPTLEESFISHNLLFELTLPIFNHLLNKNDDICPIT